VFAYLVTLDKAPTVDVDDQTPPTTVLMGTPEQIETTHPLTESLDDVLGPALFLVIELSNKPRLFAIGVSPDKTIHDGRLSGLGVRKGGAHSVDLDVLGIIDVDELFVNKRTGRSRVNKVGVKFGRLVSDLVNDAWYQLSQPFNYVIERY
jgi:hypothetical protein